MVTFAAALRGAGGPDACDRVRKLLDAGFPALGLLAPFHLREWEAVRELLPRESIVAVELFLPYPREVRPGHLLPIRLGSPRADEKDLATRLGTDTIRFAADHSVGTVIVPPVTLEGELRAAHAKFRRKATFRQVLPSLRASRTVAAKAPLDAYRSVLSRLLDVADRHAVRLAIVPGGWLDEIPDPSETETTLREFRGGPLSLWPDTLALAAASEAGGAMPFEASGSPIAGVSVRDHDDALEPVALGSGSMAWEDRRKILERSGVWLAEGLPSAGGLATLGDLQFLARLARGPDPEVPRGILGF